MRQRSRQQAESSRQKAAGRKQQAESSRQEAGSRKQQARSRGKFYYLLPTAFCFLCLLLFSCTSAESRIVQYYTVHIIRTLPHSTRSFTQGLVYHDGTLYESTGLYGQSSLQKIDIATGAIQKFLPVADVFAEGLARWNDRLIQLTWKSKTAFIYARADFSLIGLFEYDTEGWGLTADEQHLIMSNGTDVIFFRNPDSFEIERRLSVTYEGRPLQRLNELEYIDGFIYANVWYEDVIVQIEPQQGEVIGVIDATPLLKMLPPLSGDHVLNGIAYNEETKSLYLTGKNWPALFEVTLTE